MTTKDNENHKVNKIFKYKKKSGTSGVTGSLYRSHLLSLILSRNLNEESEFVLGCNVDEIGVMNEICFRLHHKDNREKPVAAFINTKYTGHITDDDLTNPKTAFHLYKCFQSFISIRERFDNNSDDLFEGTFDKIEPFFVIYTPHQNKIKNHLAELKEDDKIFTNKINDIIGTGNNKNIFKVRTVSLISVVINSTIELIGNTIAAYVTSTASNRDKITNDMKKVLKKYHSFLIPHVIKINEQGEHNSGEFNESLHENSNSHIQLLKNVLYTEILKKSKVVDEEANTNIQLLLETNEYTVDTLIPLVGTVITFNDNLNKLVYMPGVPDFIQKTPLDDAEFPKHVVDKAFVIAGMKALENMKINFDDLDIQQIITKQNIQTKEKMPESVFEEEKKLTERFVNHFYIYADQVKEKDVGKLLKKEIVKHQAKNKNTSNVFQNKPEAMLVSFHQKVQKWMLSMDKPQYLTHSCDFAKDTTNIVDPLLSVLNYNCIMELQKYPIKFNNNSFNLFSKLADTQSHFNIVSNNALLTSIKVIQYFSDKNCAFINFDNVCNMKDMELNSLIKELNIATVKTLVVLMSETMNDATKTDKFKRLVLSFPNTTFAVSNHYIEDFETVNDTINGLIDIDNINDILKHEVTVQGEETELGKIIDEFSIHLIDARILTKIITSENIEIGKQLSNAYYDEIKDSFIIRNVCEYSSSCDWVYNHMHVNKVGERFFDSVMHFDLKVFDFYNDFVTIFAEPGMGKSTLLTHLSVKTKHAYPKTWIVRMNLLNFCEDFFKWDREETGADIIKAMHLVCRAELNQKESDNHFTIEEGSEGELVVIESKELDPLASLVLKLIIHSYNSKNIFIICDGFDEICPHYEKTVVKFIKSFATDIVKTECSYCESLGSLVSTGELVATCKSPLEEAIENRTQLVITCRPYNAILKTIDTEFGVKPLFLTRLSQDEQTRFYKSYWETRIKLEELNSEQLKNVDSFFEHVNQYRLNYDYVLGRSKIHTNMLLTRLQEAAVSYFKDKVDSLESNIDKKTFQNRWTQPISILDYDRLDTTDDTDQLQLAGIPLHMKIQADLFVNQIKDTSSTKQWDMGVYTFEFYYKFLEIKLKNIRLGEKAGENISTSASLTEYENLLAEVTEEHKKLAFYKFFHNVSSHFKKVLPETHWLNIESIIERITLTEEKTGLIDQVHNGVPRFVHMVFAEYFAVEYIADMLKNELLTDDEVQQQMDFVVNCLLDSSVGIMTAFNHKLRNDKELKDVLERDISKKYIFNIWLEQGKDCEKTDNKKSCLKKVLENRLVETAWMLLKDSKNTLNSANVENFVELISDIFEFTIIIEDLITYVLDAIRRVDPAMVVKALMKCDIQLEDLPDNETILTKLREKYPGLTLTLSSVTYLGDRIWEVSQKDESLGAVISAYTDNRQIGTQTNSLRF